MLESKFHENRFLHHLHLGLGFFQHGHPASLQSQSESLPKQVFQLAHRFSSPLSKVKELSLTSNRLDGYPGVRTNDFTLALLYFSN